MRRFVSAHDGQLVHRHQRLAQLGIVQAMRNPLSPAFAGIEAVNGFLAQHFLDFLQRSLFLAAQEDHAVMR